MKEILPQKAVSILKQVGQNLPNRSNQNLPNKSKSYQQLLTNYISGKVSADMLEEIKKLHLENPENMVNFLINVYFESFGSLHDEIGNARIDSLNKIISKLQLSRIQYANENSDEKVDILKGYHSKLYDAFGDLKIFINQYISEIRVVDNRNPLKRIILSFWDIINIDKKVEMLKLAFEAFFQTLTFMSIIDTDLNRKNASYLQDAEDFLEQLSINKSISLIYNYDKNQSINSNLWDTDKLKQKLENIQTLKLTVQKYIEKTSPIEVDAKDIEFNK